MDNPWGLTEFEAKTMDAVCELGSHKLAARRLCRSVKTVEKHVHNVAVKMASAGRRDKYVTWAVWREREQCAKLCEQVADELRRDGLREQAFGASDCAGNIRLRNWPNAALTGPSPKEQR